MKILVTGSTGFIGSQLCRALTAEGHQVRAFHRPSSPLDLLEDLEVEHALGDLTQPESVESAMQDVEAVFHVAAWMGAGQAGRQYAVTVEGTRAVVQAARKAGVRRLVHTSSVAALGVPANNKPSLLNENHTWNYRPEHYPYGYAKYLAELEVQKAVAQGLDAVIVNPSVVFGAGDRYRQATSILSSLASRKLTVAAEGGINLVHIADVVDGHLAALRSGRRGERYILSGENLSFLAMLQLAAEVVGVPAPTSVLPAGLLRAAAGPVYWLRNYLDAPIDPTLLRLAGRFFFYDCSKAAQELGLGDPRPALQALEEAWAWIQRANPDKSAQK